MSQDPFASIYGQLNWDAPHGPLRCVACSDLGVTPLAGAYPSALFHYEQVLGSLGEPRSRARILMILQDPRAGEKNFQAVAPTMPVSSLQPGEHRYFCLTITAWRALKLDQKTGKAHPEWPTAETGYHYLRRYLAASGAWPYDGFLAYFISLFRPADAAVTNLAKCHFGDHQGRAVYERCAELHLSTEGAALRPNLILAFTSQLNDGRFLTEHVPTLSVVPRLSLLHPAARHNREARRKRFVAEVERNRPILVELGIDVEALLARWNADVAQAAAG